MARRKTTPDTATLDLFNPEHWNPPPVAETFEPERVKGHSDRVRIARAISETMAESELSRDEIHEEMQRHLGCAFSRNTLDRVAAQSAEAHEFTATKLKAFIQTTDDIRFVNAFLDGTDFVAIPRRYLAAVEEAILTERIEELKEKQAASRRAWRGRS